MKIHTFGDSHVTYGFRELSSINTNWLGPKLCYSFGRDKKDLLDIKKFNVQDGDIVIFSFGEIDCRCHIHKYITLTNPYTNIIDDIVNNYFEAIKENVSQFKDLKVCVFNVIPTVKKSTIQGSDDYPHLGSDEERKSYILYFNKKLKEKCIEYNFIFFDVYNNYMDNDGFLSKSLSNGDVHIKDPIHIKKFLDTLI